ncbi:hypothetical protein [Paraburkholderia phosphatilytica]|uniref:hypothetical protein n=1 Tax=Paraburkholderia phosphatilytica TaxID=2282883 RepID=UPI000E4BDEC6|nr:hypothetical protein [Paraburkholderia phosphatilytica]
MPYTTIRVSDREVQVELTVYTFAEKSDADAFEQCALQHPIETCYRRCPPVALRSAKAHERPDDPDRARAVSRSAGGGMMPARGMR